MSLQPRPSQDRMEPATSDSVLDTPSCDTSQPGNPPTGNIPSYGTTSGMQSKHVRDKEHTPSSSTGTRFGPSDCLRRSGVPTTAKRGLHPNHVPPPFGNVDHNTDARNRQCPVSFPLRTECDTSTQNSPSYQGSSAVFRSHPNRGRGHDSHPAPLPPFATPPRIIYAGDDTWISASRSTPSKSTLDHHPLPSVPTDDGRDAKHKNSFGQKHSDHGSSSGYLGTTDSYADSLTSGNRNNRVRHGNGPPVESMHAFRMSNAMEQGNQKNQRGKAPRDDRVYPPHRPQSGELGVQEGRGKQPRPSKNHDASLLSERTTLQKPRGTLMSLRIPSSRLLTPGKKYFAGFRFEPSAHLKDRDDLGTGMNMGGDCHHSNKKEEKNKERPHASNHNAENVSPPANASQGAGKHTGKEIIQAHRRIQTKMKEMMVQQALVPRSTDGKTITVYARVPIVTPKPRHLIRDRKVGDTVAKFEWMARNRVDGGKAGFGLTLGQSASGPGLTSQTHRQSQHSTHRSVDKTLGPQHGEGKHAATSGCLATPEDGHSTSPLLEHTDQKRGKSRWGIKSPRRLLTKARLSPKKMKGKSRSMEESRRNKDAVSTSSRMPLRQDLVKAVPVCRAAKVIPWLSGDPDNSLTEVPGTPPSPGSTVSTLTPQSDRPAQRLGFMGKLREKICRNG